MKNTVSRTFAIKCYISLVHMLQLAYAQLLEKNFFIIFDSQTVIWEADIEHTGSHGKL
jgi:hypothetical protein